MAVKVFIPTPLRPHVGNRESLELEGATIREVLQSLTEQHGTLRKHLYTPQGRLRNFVNVYLNDEDIRYLQREDTAVSDGDTVSIVPSIAGGSVAAAPPGLLTHEEIRRYSRHLIMPEVGLEGQRKLKQASVLCIGAGGLGSPLAMYLAAAGVGRLGIVDFDVVDESNLQRQILHGTGDVGRPKLESAQETLSQINPHVQVETHQLRLSSENALDLFRYYDVVADGTDNFPTRYLVNDACVLSGKPNVYASIFRFEGQASVFALPDGPCYRCLYPEPPPPGLVPSCAEGGVLGILPGLVGIIQATEVVKLILEQGDPLEGRLLLFDALGMKFRELKLRRDPECPVCGDEPTLHELIDYEQFCGIEPESATAVEEISAVELKQELDRGDDVFILDVRNPPEYEICRIDGAHLIPLGDLLNRINELDTSREIVAQCRSGARSAQAVQLLRQAGFRKVRNLEGGILAWARDVDPTVPAY
ncbi:MAG: molybdopterin-synthase adenylyltransferase MoeB [Acidobacteriota bacterium]|nr:molybdopterin-synthase adenylyltransferase MoeB [Acidobacteriota bacterium]